MLSSSSLSSSEEEATPVQKTAPRRPLAALDASARKGGGAAQTW